jgi:aspartate/methionine/tyrosine aminotransferase
MDEIPGFRQVPRTGVIYVMHEAEALGFSYGSPDWANLGQGSPESGELPGAPARVRELKLSPAQHAYGPVEGSRPLREKVAEFYNLLYRQGKKSQYSYRNVCLAGGGRVALTRLAASIAPCNIGHFIPDYTAYEELLSNFRSFIPIPILLDRSLGYRITTEALEEEVTGRGLRLVLISNPCNPTGQVVQGEELARWVEVGRRNACTMVFDEFYSRFLYTGSASVSAAAYVDDVETDPVIVIDGLTKNWRYPGWRLSWTIGPSRVIEAIASAGSFLDGGANHPIQVEALRLLEPETALREGDAIARVFREKRDFTLARLAAMGIKPAAEPQGAFYVWADLSGLPEGLQQGTEFFKAGLREKVITVPGVFFDVNPGRRRPTSRFANLARISYGPSMESLRLGMDGLERAIARHRAGE